MKVFKHIQLRSIKNFNGSVNIILFNNRKNRMVGDFYIPGLSNDMKITVQKTYLVGQILYRSLVPSKKRRQFQQYLTLKF